LSDCALNWWGTGVVRSALRPINSTSLISAGEIASAMDRVGNHNSLLVHIRNVATVMSMVGMPSGCEYTPQVAPLVCQSSIVCHRVCSVTARAENSSGHSQPHQNQHMGALMALGRTFARGPPSAVQAHSVAVRLSKSGRACRRNSCTRVARFAHVSRLQCKPSRLEMPARVPQHTHVIHPAARSAAQHGGNVDGVRNLFVRSMSWVFVMPTMVLRAGPYRL
jgi:hypothetical protein